jgi:hypothetical protein
VFLARERFTRPHSGSCQQFPQSYQIQGLQITQLYDQALLFWSLFMIFFAQLIGAFQQGVRVTFGELLVDPA